VVQERGALKELEFNKKVEEYLAAREGFHSAFQGLAVLGTRVYFTKCLFLFHAPANEVTCVERKPKGKMWKTMRYYQLCFLQFSCCQITILTMETF
jgi:histidinol phosphatase-like enzyme